MSIIPYIWTRGSSFTFGLQVRGGAVSGSETIRVVAKTVPALGHPPPGDAAADAVLFATVFVAAAGKVPAHWLITATAVQGLALGAGFLIADARIDFGAGVILQVDPCYIQVRERVTEVS